MEAPARGGFDEQVPTADGAPSHGWPLGSGTPLHMEVYGIPLTESRGQEAAVFIHQHPCVTGSKTPGKPLCTPCLPSQSSPSFESLSPGISQVPAGGSYQHCTLEW